MFLFRKPKRAAATPLSNFVRNASASEKKKVYVVALKKASDVQNEVVRHASMAKARSA